MKISLSEVATLPNAISVTGFALALHGASHLDTPVGLAETATGRLLDLVDGPVARATGQSSEFGATVDATLDKFAGLAIVASEWRKDLAPKAALVAMLGQNVANSVATAVAIKRHPDLDLSPTRDGKYAMASQNLALAAYAQSQIVQENYPRTSHLLRSIGHAATAVGVGYYGVKATADYVRRAK